jgi:small multidrug resistance pump
MRKDTGYSGFSLTPDWCKKAMPSDRASAHAALRITSMSYLYLGIAIIGEVIATSALKATNHFSQPGPTAIVAAGYACAFYSMSLALKTIPVGVAYAIWCGLGVVLVAVAGAVLYREVPDRPAMFGMALIIAGVVVINAYSGSVTREIAQRNENFAGTH